MTKDERSKFVATEWANYQETKDRRHLAKIAREMPFFGHSEVGEEIAKLLTPDRNMTQFKNNLWTAYKQDGERHWLETMLNSGLFENVPMGKEISKEFQSFLPRKDSMSRDDFICELYGLLHSEFSGDFRKKDIRDVQRNFPELNYESVRTVLRRKFDPKKHIKT